MTALEEVKGDVEGPCGELTTMDAVRQVKTAKLLKKEKVDLLAARGQEIQLQQQLKVYYPDAITCRMIIVQTQSVTSYKP